MSVPQLILVVAGAWVAMATITWLVIIPYLAARPGGSAVNGLMWHAVRLYARVWHRVRYVGLERLPARDHGGVIIVSNHTGAADPLLIQCACPFWIRWMMAADMMGPELAWLWRQQNMIRVSRGTRDSASLREAIRHIRAGGAVGVFPEGRITVPPREVRPFLPGVGLIVAKTRAPVLLVWVSGTPDTNVTSESLSTRSRARVEFIDLIRFEDDSDAAAIAEALRRRLAGASGWPLNDEVLPPGGPPERSNPDPVTVCPSG